ncbi:hypothetical protein STCU_06098 [Strigomonas culicis]|uniref:Glutathione S-transferase n=1 Tax=Strigomonas culicis TaxID=28005 RepID=S9VU28_9TRYP|nr:hypothetical protein STCU_06098 [Strigomonas culicis]|eukprot:EPY26750.1 hypothetical protein STCU_06098 [Strigomonas culicis]
MDTYPSPNECLPFIVYRDQVMAESKRIIEFLSTEFHVKLDTRLSRLDRATGTALIDMIDYSMNPTFYRIAFVLHPCVGTYMISKVLGIPKILARLAVRSFAADMQASYNVTAYGALTPEQYENEFLRDCEAVEQQIGDKPFLFGDEPTSYDCAVYALLIPFVNMKNYAEVSDVYLTVAQSPILVEYLHRLTERAFPDLEELMVATTVARSEVADSPASLDLDPEEETAMGDEDGRVIRLAY